jgi:hypothetical protein
MPVSLLTLDDLSARLRGLTTGADRLLVVDLDAPAAGPVPELHTGLAAVVLGLTVAPAPETHRGAPSCDVVLHIDDPARRSIEATVAGHPIASVALAGLLRGAERRSLDDALLTESAVYSALQGGPEFARWRVGRPRVERPVDAEPVVVERVGPTLTVTLNRPHVRNALNTAMRDGLVEALALPAFDPTITDVHLRGAGEAFCAGGDLDEFGSFDDPASAHLMRLQQSAGRGLAAVADRVTAHLHGACAGSGIELPAFAGTVVAHPSTVVMLPELSLGLIPGAGGTVSIARRVGRHRTARLALTGEAIDAATALAWGLVDRIADDG